MRPQHRPADAPPSLRRPSPPAAPVRIDPRESAAARIDAAEFWRRLGL